MIPRLSRPIWAQRDMLLEVDDLEIRYGRVPAVRDVSFSVGEGEIVCFVGPNGAGKSTTMLAVAGVLHPAKGTIRFDTRPLAGNAIETIVANGIALVPEGRRIFGRMTRSRKSCRRQRAARRIGTNRRHA